MIHLCLILTYPLLLIMDCLVLSYLWALVYVPDVRNHQVMRVYKFPNSTEIIDWTCSRSTEFNYIDPPLVEGWYV